MPSGNCRASFTFHRAPPAFFSWAAERHGADLQPVAVRFVEFLQRVMLHSAPLSAPRDVAFFLASYARDGLARIEAQATLPALAALKDALGASLGMTFDAVKGEHLFRSTLVQTLFYGLFSAWVNHARTSTGPFNWHAAEWNLHVPMVRALFEQIATPARLRPLGLVEVLDWAANALDRVDRDAFFSQFDDMEAVQYFYEPFLEAFDPELRKQLGVWYTPPEIVKYMVERVDRVLRTELDLPDGLADPNVWILDPCCGTGSYIVEVLRRIDRTLEEQGEEATRAAELRAAATRRVAGFEIMPAPFIIAHWQVGTLLRQAGAPLADEEGQRASIYLTNALTGWNETDPEPPLPFPELEEERGLAAEVKREQPIPRGDRQPAIQRLRRNGTRAGTRPGRRLQGGAAIDLGHKEVQPRRSLRALLQDRRTPRRRAHRRRHHLLRLELLIPRRAVLHRNAAALPGAVRQDLDRLPERRQPGDREAYSGRTA